MNREEEAKLLRHSRLGAIFTPRTPVQTKDAFAGRIDQIIQVLSALRQPGQQIVIYGERGVGKSSLANVLSQFGEELGSPVRVNCTTTDTFSSLWAKVFRAGSSEVPERWTYGSPDPDEIRILLRGMTWPFIILDEFDRWDDDDGLTAMADTMKALSDHAVRTKLVIVGVADSIDQLIGEHESVRRALEEVQLERMSESELRDIPVEGLRRVDMDIDPVAADAIARLAEGFPHYAHLLSLHAAQRCVMDDRDKVELRDVREAVGEGIKRHSLLRDYQTAVSAQRTGTLFERVLLACALAEKDRLGFFSASDVREPLGAITGKPYAIPAFSPHLKAFTASERGSVLKRVGPARRYRYRFRDPELQPFVVLTALSEGWLPPQYQDSLLAPAPELSMPELPFED